MSSKENILNPLKAIERLKEGNSRFVGGLRSVDSMLSHMKMPELASRGQKPFAIVLTCSDSRSPVEMIFDQGLVDLFVVRVAGNVVAPSLLASMEFAVLNFQSPAIVVLGHTLCGAIKAAASHVSKPQEDLPSQHLEELVGRIKPSIDETVKKYSVDSEDFLRNATISNILRSQKLIYQSSSIIQKAVEEKKLTIESALLDIASGKVDFLTKNGEENSLKNKSLSSLHNHYVSP
jgi:carbonic anhydrase